jgi:hypothetical protein
MASGFIEIKITVVNPENDVCKICGEQATLSRIEIPTNRDLFVYYFYCKECRDKSSYYDPTKLIFPDVA